VDVPAADALGLAPPRAVPRATLRPLVVDVVAAATLFVLAVPIYLVIGAPTEGTDPFFPLAEAFLHGRTWIEGGPYTWLEVVPRIGGGWFIPFPPIPTIFVLPIAVFSGHSGDVGMLSAFLGALSVVLMFGCLERIGVPFVPRLALALAYAFGSELTWAAGDGGTHLYAQVLGETFLLGALYLGLWRRWPLLAGLLLAAGGGSRLPVAFALPVLMYLYRGERSAWAKLIVGTGPIVLGVMAYNDIRFGSPFQFGYGLIVASDGSHVVDEKWFADGIVSLSYIPRGLYWMFLRSFDVQDGAPWVVPSLTGESILLTMPALAWLVRTSPRDELAMVLAAGAGLVLLPDLMHGSWGFAQFGYRFILDALPLLWLMLGLVIVRTGLGRWLAIALAAGVAVFGYAFWAIYGLGILGSTAA
jgi:hypothetical protein